MTSERRVGPLDQVALFCRDIERSSRFYAGALGLPHLGTFGDLAFFDMGGVRLYLHRTDDEDWRPGSLLYFVAEDIAERADALTEAGVAFSHEPHIVHRDEATSEETWMAFFEDPDGNMLALTSRVATT